MCYTVSIFAQTHAIETDTGALFEHPEDYEPYYHVSGFAHRRLPLITNADSDTLQMCTWGLIPRWTRDDEGAKKIQAMTLNARRETVFEKPSFRDAIVKRRALLPVNGFVEWHHEGSIKQPHYVQIRSADLFTLGCVWEDWTHPESGELHRTFSIVTTDANLLMSHVHNAKQRMPVVILPNDREQWLHADDREFLEPLMRPLEDGLLQAYPVTREVSRIAVNTREIELLEPVGGVQT